MKVILVGYPGSQKIVKASQYLAKKYLPSSFDVTYLNYTGPIKGWSNFVAEHLRRLDEGRVIFALDDFLIGGPTDIESLNTAIELSETTNCVKLCYATEQEHEEYPATCQYCIWDKDFLIWLLGKVNTPWEFEIIGSQILKEKGIVVKQQSCVQYFCNSALSGRWKGINVTGVTPADVKELQDMGLLPKEGLISEKLCITDKIVVFGGSGYLGTALIARMISAGHKNIVAIARNEGKLVALKEKFPLVQIIVGDISDPWTVKTAMTNAKEVYLLSAMKHVGLAETSPNACALTNIVGTMNVLSDSLHSKPRVLVFISSDKAAQGSGVYGCSKKIGERLVAEAQEANPDTKYRVIRYGNVWGSTGSIATKWAPKMQKGEEVVLTDPDASRFFWTAEEAVDLIFESVEKANDASPYIPKMKAATMGTVLEAMMDVHGKSPVKVIGLQPGENKFETMDGVTFSNQVEHFTKEEFIEKFLGHRTFGPIDAAKEQGMPIRYAQGESHPKISCVLITRHSEYPNIIMDRVDDRFFDEIIVVPESGSVYERYIAARKAKNDIIYVQDDDCMVNYQVLFRHFRGWITNAMPKDFIKKYEGSGITLVGWGCYFHKSALSVFDKYIAKYGEDDPHLLREADRIFTYLNKNFNTVIMPHEDLPQTPDKMSNEAIHSLSMNEAINKVLAL